jgi:hypothetical protein
MEFSLPEFPTAPGAQAAFVAAALMIVVGLVFLAFPTACGRVLNLQSRDTRPGGIGVVRTAGGFFAGLALAALMFDQPVLYTALGVALAVAAFGRIVSLMSDRSVSVLNVLMLAAQIVLAGAALTYFFDVVTPDLQVSLPEEADAQRVFYSYVVYAAIGAMVMFAPRIACMASGLQALTEAGVASIRSAGGFLLGASATAIVMDNPMLELGFGAAAAIGAVGTALALVLNRGNAMFAIAALAVQCAVAFLVISHVAGMM